MATGQESAARRQSSGTIAADSEILVTAAPPRRAQTTLAFHSSRIVVDVGVIIVMAAMSLPHLTVGSSDRGAVAMDALPALLLVIPIFVITLIPDHSRPIPTLLGWPSLVLGLAAFPYSIVKFLDTSVLADTLGGEVAIGARILALGTFVIVVGIVIGLGRNMLKLPTGGAYPTTLPEASRTAQKPRTPQTKVHDTLVAPPAKPAPAKPARSQPPGAPARSATQQVRADKPPSQHPRAAQSSRPITPNPPSAPPTPGRAAENAPDSGAAGASEEPPKTPPHQPAQQPPQSQEPPDSGD